MDKLIYGTPLNYTYRKHIPLEKGCAPYIINFVNAQAQPSGRKL